MTTTQAPAPEMLVGMGQIAAGDPPQRLRAIVGSCIALALHHPRSKKAVLAHIVLPESAGRSGTPGKFADTAVPGMLALFKELGLPPQGLTAKYAGGANMFGSKGPLQIGDANIRAVIAALQSAGVRVVGDDVGGNRGRRVTFQCEDGAMLIECAGQLTRTL